MTGYDVASATYGISATNADIPAQSFKKSAVSPDSEVQSEASFFKWPKWAVLRLLEQYNLNKSEMHSPAVRKMKVWEKIAQELKENGGYRVTGEQCSNKFKSLTTAYNKKAQLMQRERATAVHV